MWLKIFIYVFAVILLVFLIYVIITVTHFHRVKVEPITSSPTPSGRVIVSLSPLPSRVKHLQEVVKQMNEQTFSPDMICINIPSYSKREKRRYPPEIKDLKSTIPIKIIRCDDHGPLTKLLPTVKYITSPDDIIITIDDDHIYHKDLIKRLVNGSKMFPNACVGFGGWNYTIVLGFFIQLYAIPNSKVNILQGYKGTAYRRKFFYPDFFTDHDKYKECFTVDDIYISFHLRKHNIPIYKLNYGEESPILHSKKLGSPLGEYNLSNFIWGKCVKKLERT